MKLNPDNTTKDAKYQEMFAEKYVKNLMLNTTRAKPIYLTDQIGSVLPKSVINRTLAIHFSCIKLFQQKSL